MRNDKANHTKVEFFASAYHITTINEEDNRSALRGSKPGTCNFYYLIFRGDR